MKNSETFLSCTYYIEDPAAFYVAYLAIESKGIFIEKISVFGSVYIAVTMVCSVRNSFWLGYLYGCNFSRVL